MSRTKPRRRAPEHGRRIAAARQAAGLRQKDLADRVGVNRITIVRLEVGEHFPRVDVALAIAHELNTTVETLFGGER